jgi:hypothetical protein
MREAGKVGVAPRSFSPWCGNPEIVNDTTFLPLAGITAILVGGLGTRLLGVVPPLALDM